MCSETAGLLIPSHRIFNDSIEQLTHLVKATYRDICENITGAIPDLSSGDRAQLGVIAVTKDWPCNESLQS